MSLETILGLAAAVCTTASHLPQLYKSWRTGETKDLSLKMIVVLWAGLALWLVYGFQRGDAALIFANGASLLLLSGVLYFKLWPRQQ